MNEAMHLLAGNGALDSERLDSSFRLTVVKRLTPENLTPDHLFQRNGNELLGIKENI